MMDTHTISIHDIKPLVEIQEYSLYYLIATVSIVLILVAISIYFFSQWYKKRNSFNIRVYNKELLKNIDFKNPKTAAYDITQYGAIFQDDSENHQKMYKEIVDYLQEYKYKKYVNAFDKEIETKIDTYLEMIDV